MKEKVKLIVVIILFTILALIVASLIGDFLTFIIGDKINSVWFSIIYFIFIFLSIKILFKTQPGRYIEDKLFKKRKNEI